MNDLEYYGIRKSGLSFDAASRSTYAVTIVLGRTACTSQVGQSIALNLLNLVLRFINNVTVVIPSESEELRIRFPFAAKDLAGSVEKLVDACDPRAHVEVISNVPIVGGKVVGDYSIGIGDDIGAACDLYLSANRFIGTSSKIPISSEPTNVFVGAGVAALVGAANIARHINRQEPLVNSISAWNFVDGDTAEAGPDEWTPLNIGRARVVGAGAVASALFYWLHQWGDKSFWDIVDADIVHLKNISKTVAYSTNDSVEIGKNRVKKVDVLARLLNNVSPFDAWYDEWDKDLAPQPDVVVPLANERGVRARLASESNTVVLHATTDTDWNSFLHRHIAGRDDCVACRLPDTRTVTMACSTGAFARASVDSPSRDSSLPFVGAASGLMLAVLLKRLELSLLADLDWNGCVWMWQTENKFRRVRKYSCEPGCQTFLPPGIRTKINSAGRWSFLDGAG